MKKLLGIVVLGLLLSGNANADWKKISYSDVADLYFDPETITNDGTSKYVWLLIDQKNLVNDSMSRKVHLQIQCGKRKYLIEHIILYEKNFGLGNVVSSVTERNSLGDWRSAVPDSILYPAIKKICN
tara:strand:- start:132 stop:512 length:381 start_codon:yes stop_codon:yes gene_type:complete